MEHQNLKPAPPLKLDAIIATNSNSFVLEILEHYKRGVPFIILRDKGQLSDLDYLHIDRIIEPAHDHGWLHHRVSEFRNDENPAQISLTSGTEGQPKAIVLSYRALGDVVTRLNAAMDLGGEIKEYVGVPTAYSFGLGRFRACSAVGGSTYLPPRGFDPIEIAQMLDRGEINAISAVPTLWKTVIANPELFAASGERVLWIEIGSQYMPRADKERLKELFPNAKIIQHYGLTEASRSTFLDISATAGESLESVGRATGEVQVRISEEGLVEIRGPHVALGTLTRQGIVPITDDRGWLRTKDKGELIDGHLFYQGRADDLINCGGIKLSPVKIEEQLLDALGIPGGLAVGRFPDENRGEGVLVAVEQSAGINPDQARRQASLILEKMGLRAGSALRVVEIEALPRTATGKVQRRLLAGFADQERVRAGSVATGGDDFSSDGLPLQARELERKLVEVWKRVLRSEQVSRSESFYDSGGDSLSAIAMMLALEKADIDKEIAAKVFDGESIAEIVRAQAGQAPLSASKKVSERTTGDVINIVRGILVLCLISIHYLPGVWERTPLPAEKMNIWLHPFYRFGTPGFALVFGMGVGFFYFKQMNSGTAHAWRRVRFSALIVFSGILLLGLFRLGDFAFSLPEMPSPLISSMFYSVLVYYLLAVLSIPLWFRLVYRAESPILRPLTASGICFLIYTVLDRLIGQEPLASGPFELVRLMLEAKYNYFRMTSIVMIGVAVGLAYRKQTDLDKASRSFLTAGLLLVLFSVMIPYDMGLVEHWLTMNDAELFSIVGYTGLVLVMVGVMTWIRPRVGRRGPLGMLLRILAVCGILSLPAYIGHDLVIPGKDIVASLTPISESVALLGSLGVFFLISALVIRKVYRLYG